MSQKIPVLSCTRLDIRTRRMRPDSGLLHDVCPNLLHCTAAAAKYAVHGFRFFAVSLRRNWFCQLQLLCFIRWLGRLRTCHIHSLPMRMIANHQHSRYSLSVCSAVKQVRADVMYCIIWCACNTDGYSYCCWQLNNYIPAVSCNSATKCCLAGLCRDRLMKLNQRANSATWICYDSQVQC